MHVQIDEARCDDASRGVEGLTGRGFQHAGRGELGDASVAQEHVHVAVDAAGRIDDAASGDEQRRVVVFDLRRHFAALSTVARMAMRVFTPLATCSCTQDCGPSATSLASSRPRTMGPGCMTMASGLASFMRWGVI